MKVKALKTRIVNPGDNLFSFLEESIDSLEEKSVVVVTSKIISYCQGRLVAKDGREEQKHELVRQEADFYLDPNSSKYNLMLTIKGQSLAVNAGIDESNAQADGEEVFILWPENLQETTNQIWQFLRKKFGVKDLGVIVTDSRSILLYWGVVGMSIANCGFRPLNDQRGAKDIFGREIKMVQESVTEALAAAAVFEMGEVAETKPLAIVTDLEKVDFMDRPLNDQELKSLKIARQDDMYGPLLNAVEWKKGGSGKDFNGN